MSQSEADKKYKAAMKQKGFVKKAYWVHASQVQELSNCAKKLRAEKDGVMAAVVEGRSAAL